MAPNASRDYHRAHEAAVEAVVTAMAERFREVTGKPAEDKMLEELYYVVRFYV